MSSDNIDNIDEFMYIALSILSSRYENSILPDILFLVSSEQLVNIIRALGGKSVRIPSSNEFSIDLLAAVAAYHSKVNGYSFDKISKIMNIDGRTMRAISRRLEHWEEWMESEGVVMPLLTKRSQ